MIKIKVNKSEDPDAKDVEVDGRIVVHIKRGDVGYSIDVCDVQGDIIHEIAVWDDEI